jgi:short-subunit dehydrogenase
MHKIRQRYGDWALVAGAAEGLGAAFSNNLAGWGMNIIMIDKDEGKMNETAMRMKKAHNVEVVEMCLDLSDINEVNVIIEKISESGCRLLIYNAAFGPVKNFLDNKEEELDYYIDLNSRMPLHLVYRFIKTIPQGQKAGILLMSSLAGLWGTQLVVPYGATKAFDYNLAEGLYYELSAQGIDVMACCAGATDTPNYRNTKPKKNLLGPSIMDPVHVAEKALENLGKKAVYIPGFTNQLTNFLLTRILPRSISARIMNRVMLKMYRS